jgi:RNA polymerase sigma factor (sigma-70 family)
VLEPVIIMKARAGDGPALEQVVRHVLTLALRVAASITASRELAEDIAQDTAIHAVRSLRALRDPARLDGWVVRMATTESLQQLRRPQQRRESPRSEIERSDADPTADLAFDRVAASPELLAALGSLQPRQRAALALRYALDLDDRQIARALDCRVGTVHALLSRGRAQLRANPSLSGLRPEITPAEKCPTLPHGRKR